MARDSHENKNNSRKVETSFVGDIDCFKRPRGRLGQRPGDVITSSPLFGFIFLSSQHKYQRCWEPSCIARPPWAAAPATFSRGNACERVKFIYLFILRQSCHRR